MVHQKIYNQQQQAPASPSSFTRFGLLPEELRLAIWTASLEGFRIVKVYLKATSSREITSELSSKYSALVRGDRILSKLLRINREARQVALRFYHIHLPCQLYGRGKEPQSFVAHLNPTYDFIHIVAPSPAEETLPGFLYDLKKYDAKNVGLLNLAFDHSSGLLQLRPENMSPAARTLIAATFSQLREVFWVVNPQVGRANAGAMGSVRGIGVQFNAGFPIFASTLRFDRIPRDPRPIARDLERVVIGGPDPREIINGWYGLLNMLSIRAPSKIRYSLLLAVSPNPDEERKAIYSYKDAEEKLDDESAKYREKLRTLSKFRSKPIQWEPSTTVGAAFGFWLIPVEPNSAAPLGLSSHVEHKWNHIVDIRDKWPELGLSHLQLE